MAWYKIETSAKKTIHKVKDFAFETEIPDPATTAVSGQTQDEANQLKNNLVLQLNEFIAEYISTAVTNKLAMMNVDKVNFKNIEQQVAQLKSDAAQKLYSGVLVGKLKEANKNLHDFYMQNPNTVLLHITTQDLEIPAQDNFQGVQTHLGLPYGIQNGDQQDQNIDFLKSYIYQSLTKNGITDDAEGAAKLATIIADNEDPYLRVLINEYFGKRYRQNFHDILVSLNYPTLAEEFSKIENDVLNYVPIKKGRIQAEVLPDEVYGEIALTTASNAERKILQTFRNLGLQPVPQEIQFPSDKNTYFRVDFLLPANVLSGVDEYGKPVIKTKVIFVGEYFGYSGEKYDSQTVVKTKLEPIQAVMTGNDIIHITKQDFDSGTSPQKLINQLDAKNIIYNGGLAESYINKYAKDNPEFNQDLPNIFAVLTPAAALIKSCMLQVEAFYGKFKNFTQEVYNDPRFEQVAAELQETTKPYRLDILKISNQIRQLQLRKQTEENKAEQAKLFDYWRSLNQKISDTYLSNKFILQLTREHQEQIANDPEFNARMKDLQIAYDMLTGNPPKDLPENLGENNLKRAEYICMNSMAGLSSITRKTSRKFTEFKQIFAKTNSFNKFINRFADKLIDDLLY